MFSFHSLDARLVRRARCLCQAMIHYRCVQISRLATCLAQQMAYYRLLANDRFSLKVITDAITQQTALLARADHVLVIEDTTQVNLQRHAGHLAFEAPLGVIADRRSLGFFLHASLVVEPERCEAIGFSDVRLWSRPASGPDKHERRYKQLPVEAKESYRWIAAALQTRARLQSVERLTFVCDRENDAYDFFARVTPQADVLVRMRDDRRIEQAPGKLYAFLAAQPCAGSYEIELKGDLSRGRAGRRARIEVRFGRVTLRKPATLQGVAETVTLYAIEAKEAPESVPKGAKPVHWRLLTSHEVTSFAAACEVISWYTQRWHIEQVFRLMKREGLNIESSELEDGEAIEKLTLIGLEAALDVMRLLLAREGTPEQPIGHVFSDEQVVYLEALGPRLEGRTEKQRNPHRKRTLAWATWIIARLGSWKGLASQGKPGPITLFRGLERFHQQFLGWKLGRDLYNT